LAAFRFEVFAHGAACHTKAGKKSAKKKLDHFDTDTYPFGGEHTAFIGDHIRDVLGLSGKKVTMPSAKRGSVKGTTSRPSRHGQTRGKPRRRRARPPHDEDPDKD
jgi:hypothetical protein